VRGGPDKQQLDEESEGSAARDENKVSRAPCTCVPSSLGRMGRRLNIVNRGIALPVELQLPGSSLPPRFRVSLSGLGRQCPGQTHRIESQCSHAAAQGTRGETPGSSAAEEDLLLAVGHALLRHNRQYDEYDISFAGLATTSISHNCTVGGSMLPSL
jgi:hypothetical protein